MYICKNCKKVFEKKSGYTRHYEKCNESIANYLESKSKIRNVVDHKHECPYCNKKYKTSGRFKNHLTKCMNMNSKAENQPQTVIQNINNIHYGDVDNRVINVNVNNFQFNLPGQETIKHIDQEKLLQIFNKPFPYAIRELMRLVYFNEEVPENNRWCIAFPKDEYGALTYNHETDNVDRWMTDNVVDSNFENMMFLISPVVDQVMGDQEIFDSLSQCQKQNLNLFYSYFGISELSKQNPKDFKNIKMMAYNNKSIPLELWEKLSVKGNYKH